MIVEERLVTYLNSLDIGNPLFLMELEEEAHKNFVPVIRAETQNLLKLLLAMNRQNHYNRELCEADSHCQGKFCACRKAKCDRIIGGRCGRGHESADRAL